jgi:hypothetical protein
MDEEAEGADSDAYRRVHGRLAARLTPVEEQNRPLAPPQTQLRGIEILSERGRPARRFANKCGRDARAPVVVARITIEQLNFPSDAMNREQAIENVAGRYRSEGYQVTVQPKGSQVPSFATGLPVDLLATKGDEHVLVQVKESTEDLRNDQESVLIAEAVKDQPGWRFDVVVLNGHSLTEKWAHEAPEPSIDAILRNLEHAERTAQGGDHPTSFIIAWASLEAAMRRAAREEGIDLQNISPLFLLRTLYSNGLLDREELDRLNGFLRLRNALVHGLEPPSIDTASTLYVIAAARKLLGGAVQEKSSK